ncbi:MerR family DNA-binding transcriptional regulator [Butyrivibrio sp. MC2021]|uniref:MerR family DNA-binding transcriptional regulator n=1 Tax=Butyrivibrio sp. MC2021 TaxID=1408306 RepID=UPI000479ECE0|nr:MerR family DNA-binding transcriptional regulator [Butyrivibrio sp. MC2021]
MTIKEVEQLLEVPRATIRFYEKENLIKPVREVLLMLQGRMALRLFTFNMMMDQGQAFLMAM